MGLSATAPREVGPGKWEFTVNLPPEPMPGQDKLRYPKTKRTFTFTDATGKPVGKREGARLAEKARERVLLELEQHDCTDPDRLTFAELCRRWMTAEEALVGDPEDGLRPVTMEFYRGYLDRHLLPAFGRRIATTLRPADVIQLCADKRTIGLSGSTTKHITATIRAAFSWAIEAELLDAGHRNPGVLGQRRQRRGGARKSSEIRPEFEVWTPDQIATAVLLADGQLVQIPAMLAGWCGLRRGEVCGLRIDDFDDESGLLHVQRAIEQTGGGTLHVTPPKTASGDRYLEPPEALADALRQRREAIEGMRVRRPGWNPEGYVVTTAAGRPVKPRNLSSSWSDFWRRRCEAEGLPRIRLHDLRHSFATDLIRQGVDIITVSKLLGHADPAITAALYVHPDTEMRHKAAMRQNRRVAAALAKADVNSRPVRDSVKRLRVVAG